jgi:hypothetical protein
MRIAILMLTATVGCHHADQISELTWAPVTGHPLATWQPKAVVVSYQELSILNDSSSSDLAGESDIPTDLKETWAKKEPEEVIAILASEDRCLIQVTPTGYWFHNLVAVLDLVRLKGRWLLHGIGLAHRSDIPIYIDGNPEPAWLAPFGLVILDPTRGDAKTFGCRCKLSCGWPDHKDSFEMSFLATARRSDAELPPLLAKYLTDSELGK